ncbi:hypothetical protein POX_b02590 [Penicillium oxalicum]|uniref:Uncharacterized protein n=1 Tax=Penicillium oxalicum (strain 114-2 / CGMCC 5302) TaxID=933388 RepID=S7ZP32_PENO1|nr:hypothetical protein POX_b02590 [Penicillium oxalicum]EPS30401.1 hypothetical protein PDE_05352 [Penicillium oxalicum 114-2]KAI2792552.1 hypothetical protein POX_b02590 [Penicillium oxalicum]
MSTGYPSQLRIRVASLLLYSGYNHATALFMAGVKKRRRKIKKKVARWWGGHSRSVPSEWIASSLRDQLWPAERLSHYPIREEKRR